MHEWITRMKFRPTKFDGAWVIALTELGDERGFFARTFCSETLRSRGLASHFPQHSVSYSSRRGTLRGLHFQRAPHAEVKIVRCLRGAVWDVIVDLRPEAPTFLQWQAFELTAENRLQLYVPKGFAHGFQSLTADAEVSYMISELFVPDAASGVRFDDAAFGISWPLPVSVMSGKDRTWPNFK